MSKKATTKKTMYEKEIEIPESVKAELQGRNIKISGAKGKLERELGNGSLKIELAGGKLKVSSESSRRKSKALVGTAIAHARNMIHGVTKGYTYKLKIIYSHFPVTVKVDDANKQVFIQNFIGEKTPRVAKITGDSKVEVNGSDIAVTGIDADAVSQTAATIEQATRIKMHDRKVFQDGIYLVTKERGKD